MMNHLLKLFSASLLILIGGCAGVETTPPSAQPAQPPLTTSSPVASSSTSATPVAAPSPPEMTSPTLTPTDSGEGTLVVPGERVGEITRDTSRQELAQIFGEANLRDEAVAVGEGFVEQGTVVNPGGDRSLAVLWADSDRTQPKSVRILSTDWQTPEGIGIGTSFAELREELGEFQLYGFGWDYGGTLILENTPLDEYDGSLILRVQPASETMAEQTGAIQAVMGDQPYPASDPHFQELGLQVNEMVVEFSP